MERLRVAVAVVLVAAYLGMAIYSTQNASFQYPPGLAVIVGAAVTFLLGGPAIKRITGLKFETKEESKDAGTHDA